MGRNFPAPFHVSKCAVGPDGAAIRPPPDRRLPVAAGTKGANFSDVTEEGIQAFYERFLATLDAAGVPVVILGGQAMLRHRLAETTKDADLYEASRRALLGYPPEFAEFLPPRSVVLQPWKTKS